MVHDVFICHASEDKDSLVRPLVRALRRLGLKVWFDETELVPGDSLTRKVDRAWLTLKLKEKPVVVASLLDRLAVATNRDRERG